MEAYRENSDEVDYYVIQRCSDKAQFAAFLDFVLEMRKDLCNNKTKLTKHDILLNLTQSEDEAKKLFE